MPASHADAMTDVTRCDAMADGGGGGFRSASFCEKASIN